ncbi:MAG: N-acetyltransferase [Burkholderiales bacterium]|nr:N-acetyltransferase [Burkholderiales bacterium]
MADSPSLTIVHNAAQQRFEAAVTGGTAYVVYRPAGKVLHLVHTEVPAEAGGAGVAGKLVQAALDHAAANGLKVFPTCTYVRAYMKRHPETHALLAPGVHL